jgi:hypothetical protein
MKWENVLKNWKHGIIPTYPMHIKTRFIWRTNSINNNKEYLDEMVEDKQLPTKQDYTSFQEHIHQSNNRYVTSFPNLSHDTILVIPMPKKNKNKGYRNFSTIKDFIDNASNTQQRAFWKKVYNEIEEFRRIYPKVWVSTHGKGVSYLHVRISSTPKYYDGSLLAKI